MVEQEIKAFEKAIKILEEKMDAMTESLDNEINKSIEFNKLMQISGVNLSIYYLKGHLKSIKK